MGWPGRAQRPKANVEQDGEASKLKELTMHTHQQSSDSVATIGLDIGKNTFHLVGLDKRGAIAMRIKVSRNQLIRRLVNLPPCLIGLEAGSGSHHIARQIKPLGHDVRLIPAQYVKPFLKGHKNDYRDAEAIAEAVQRPTMNFVAIKTPEQSDLLSLHRVRSRLVRQRTAIINQIRGFLIERGITVRQGPAPLRKVLPEILSSPPEALSPRLLRLISELDEDWRRLDERLQALSAEIESLSDNDVACQRLMTVPGIGPIISSAVVAAIGTGSGFKQGRDFAAWLGLVPEAGVDRRSHQARQDLQARQQVPTHPLCAGRPRRPPAASRRGHARSLALDRAGLQALGASQSARHRARQQTRAHRLGRARARPRLRTKDHPQCRIRSARSDSPREWMPSLSATLARQSFWIG